MRDRLLEAAERLLAADDSFSAVSVGALVEEAGVSRSTFYNHFSDVGELLRAWFEEIIAELVLVTSPWWDLGPQVTREQLRDVLAGIVHTYRPHTPLMSALYDTSVYDATVRRDVTRMMDNNVASLARHIKLGQAGGFVDPGLWPRQTAAWLTWMAERGLHQLIRNAHDDQVVDELIEGYADVVWGTLYAFR